jgi:hypothetical protein
MGRHARRARGRQGRQYRGGRHGRHLAHGEHDRTATRKRANTPEEARHGLIITDESPVGAQIDEVARETPAEL